MKNNKTDRAENEVLKKAGAKSPFDWWLFSFITIVIILLVVLLSYK